jgi:hypothetical protein
VCELDQRLELGELIEQHLKDSHGKSARFCFGDLLRRALVLPMPAG